MTNDVYMVAIASLFPLVAILLVLQTNPYQALVIRGILGAIAALVYAMLGAADVALTEALVGTMLSITLYAIAVRSSMTLRIGIIQQQLDQQLGEQPGEQPGGLACAPANESADESANELANKLANELASGKPTNDPVVNPIDEIASQQASTVVCTPSTDTFQAIEQAFSKHHVRVEVLSYTEPTELERALQKKEIHIAYETDKAPQQALDKQAPAGATGSLKVTGSLRVRTQQLYNILQAQLPSSVYLSLIKPEPSNPSANPTKASL